MSRNTCPGWAAGLMLLFAPSAVLTADAPEVDQQIMENWKKLDANSDGKVTPTENRSNADQAFKIVDTNSDGTVSLDEYVTAMKGGD